MRSFRWSIERDRSSFCSYIFFRYKNETTNIGGEETAEEIVTHAKDLVNKYGFTSHKLRLVFFTRS
jgi:glucarate dehydratase